MEKNNIWLQEAPTDDQLDEFFEDSFDEYDVIVSVSSLSVRSGPDPEKTLVSVVYRNDKLTVLEHGVSPDGQLWGRIKNGWINLKYIKKI